jgi:hypothetical protein
MKLPVEEQNPYPVFYVSIESCFTHFINSLNLERATYWILSEISSLILEVPSLFPLERIMTNRGFAENLGQLTDDVDLCCANAVQEALS